MKRKIIVSIACILGIGVAIAFFVPPPIEGYYRSAAATFMDSVSTGYLLLRDGRIYVVNFSPGHRDELLLGIYSKDGANILVSDQVNAKQFNGRAFLWGIHWEGHGNVDKFTRRAFPERMAEPTAAASPSVDR